jgi:hypothetical protein
MAASGVLFKVFAAGPDSDPDTQNCIIHLTPTIWINSGGWWSEEFFRKGVVSDDNAGRWRQSSSSFNMIIGTSRDDASDQIFQLKDVPNPMTVNKTGTGTLLKAGNSMPDGPIRWQIIKVRTDPANMADDGDGDDDDG